MRLTIGAAVLTASLLLSLPAWSQTAPAPSADAMQAARELVVTIKLADQFKAILPIVMKTLKPAIVQDRPAVEKDFDELMPAMLEAASARRGELVDAMAVIYAQAMTADELRQMIVFYKSPVGQKVISITPAITQRSMVAGQAWGRSVAEIFQAKMVDELRKRGHNI
jgi:hypothetical protein